MDATPFQDQKTGADPLPRPPLRWPARVLVGVAAVALALFGAAPALRVGFLSDDYHFVRRISQIAGENPGLGARLARGVEAFGRWHPSFQAFRPLTVATLQIDHAVHGLDARGFRATNVVLWLLAAWIFSAVCRAYLGIESVAGRAAAFLVFAWWPLAIEPLAWTVIRQDSLLAVSALGGALILKRHRGRPWLVTAPLIAALASKETAIALPAVFAALDAALLRREGVPARRLAGALARRSWPWFAAAAAFAAARRAAGARTVWNGKSFAETLFSAEMPAQFARSLASSARALVLPVNQEREGWGFPALALAFAGVLALVALVAAIRRARCADLVAAACWFFGPLSLTLPFYVVAPSLNAGRALVLPGVAWLFGIVAGAAVIARRFPRAVLVCAAVFLSAEAIGLRFNLGSFVDTFARIERILADARAWPAGPVHVLGARAGDAVIPSLMSHEGVWVFTSLPDALAPPFVTGPRIVIVEDGQEPDLAALVRDEATRGLIAATIVEPAGPRFRTLCGAPFGPRLEIAPAHGTAVSRGDVPRFTVTLPPGSAPGDSCRITVGDRAGNVIDATVAVSPGARVIEFGPGDFGLLPAATPLANITFPFLIWNATLLRVGVPVARSAYAVVNLR